MVSHTRFTYKNLVINGVVSVHWTRIHMDMIPLTFRRSVFDTIVHEFTRDIS